MDLSNFYNSLLLIGNNATNTESSVSSNIVYYQLLPEAGTDNCFEGC
jgi:hypothetical protein